MKNLIEVELFKLHKKKVFLFIIAFNSISLLYGLGMYFGWSWITFKGQFDLILYVGSMWQLLFIIGIPLILFMYIGASIIGTERIEGQILLEVTRVANKSRLIYAKFITMLGIILFYFISNIVISSLSYVLILRKTSYVTAEWIIINTASKNLIGAGLGVLFYIIFSVFIVMCISVKKSTLISTISGLILFLVLSLCTRIIGVQEWIPGYLALAQNANFSVRIVVYQFLICIALTIFAMLTAKNNFKRMDL